jgi:purine nucleoside permease
MVSRLAALAAALLIAALSPPPYAADVDSPAFAPKVLVITMFGGEAKPWLEGEPLVHKLALPGLSKAYPEVACTDDGLCVMTTNMGYANAASSIAALVFGGRLDLTKTYFLISGIAGVDPAQGTLGSAHWARFAVDRAYRTRSTHARRRPTGARAIWRLARRRRVRKPSCAAATKSIASTRTCCRRPSV